MQRIFMIFTALITCSCQQTQDRTVEMDAYGKKVRIALERVSDDVSQVKVDTFDDNQLVYSSTWPLNYPVYRFEVGDVTANGVPEIAVGVIKTTRYDTQLAKRLFLFQITDEYDVRPLWLGSRVSHPLEDFVLTGDGKVMTIEWEQNGKFLVAQYRYHGFGLTFGEYIKREISRKEAYKIMNYNQ